MERHFLMISRALNARKRKIFALFFALAAVVTGAMAQEESLLTTLTFGESETYGETTSGVVTVTATNVGAYNGTYGWLLDEGGSLSVTAKEGYTITKCVFHQNAKAPITDTEAPFEIHANNWGGIIEDPYEEMNGVTSIEVYGYANAGGGSAATEVTITQNDFPQYGQSFTKDGVTVSAGSIDPTDGNLMGDGTFSTTLGNFTKIEVTCEGCEATGTGWSGNFSKKTWAGTPASTVSFSGNFMGMGMGITIVCTIEEPTVAVTGVTLNQNEAQMTVGGETLTLIATVNPNNATDQSVSWSTNDANVATVENGVVTAVAAGNATITVTTTDGHYSATCAVTVSNPAPAATIVTITNNDFPGMDVSFTKDGVTVSADWIDNMQSGNLVAPGSFSTTLGNFTKIEVNAGEIGSLGEGWSGNSERQTWTGNASSVSFSGDISGLGHGITIMFTIEAAAPAKPTLTLSDKVSILGMPIAGITDLGNNNYEVEPGTEFQIQAAAAPEHYNFVGWSDLDTTDPNYSANPRTITINSDLTIKPLYALEAFTITLTSNDTTMGKVTLRAGSGGGEDGDMSIANNADLEGANTSRNIAVGADGSIHVVYKSTEDQSVKYIKSIDGVTFTEPVTVANGARECEVAVSSNGKVYVSYYVENDGGYIAYSADGTSFTSVMVDDNAASIHMATDGDYVYGVNMPGTNFYYSSDGGQTYNMHSGWSGYMFSDVMVDPLNHNVVVIKDMPEVVVRYSTDHGATFTEEAPVMVQGGNDQLAIFFSTATMGDGKVYMAGADAFVAIIDYKTATCTKTDVNLTDNRSLCADPVGNVIVGVEQNENLYYQLSTNSAVSFGDKVLVSNGSGANAALNYHDGTLLYLFTKDNKLYLATRTGIVPTESVVDNGDGTYAVQYGTEVTFTAKAKPGYHVESWSNAVEVNDIIVATQTLEVNSAMTIGATFAANPILTIATNDSTKGIVSLEGAGQGAGQGAEAAEINPDMAPQSWQGDETLITVNDLPGFGSMSEADALEWGLTSAIEGMCKLIYAEADGGQFKFMDFYNGGYSMDGVSFMDRDRIYSTLSEGIPVYYAIGGEAIEGIIDLGGGQYSVVPGTELTFVAKPAEEHYLVSWNDEPATSNTLKLTMTGELALTANFAHVPYMITLPEGVSIVAPVPAGITAKGNGVYEVVDGTEFQISADIIPEHHHFDHWADLADSAAQYSANPRTIVASENLTIEPIFAIDTYTLTLATNDSTKGVVSVIGAGQGEGEGVDIVWDADFWNGIQAYMNGEDYVHANNSKDGITITFDGGDFENGLKDGNIKLDNSDNKLIFTSTVGKIKKIEIRGYASYKPEGWSRDGGLMWEGTPSDVVELFGQATFVHFVSATFTIEPDATTGKIVDNGDGTYTVDYGTELTFVAKPAEGYMLASWNGEPALSDTLKLTMTEELSLTANFKHIPATITLPEGVSIVGMPIEGITSKGEGVYEVEYGTEFQISADIIPEHYHFGHWADLADSAAMYAANPRTIVAGENLTIEPIFAIDTYTLTLATNDSTKGIVSLEGAGQGGEPEPSAQLIVPESWSSEVGVTITAADLPGFVASTEEAVKALPVPTEGSVFVIYNFKDDGGVEAVTFENGEYVRTTSSKVDRANISYYSNQGMIFLYTTAAGQAGQGGEGEEPEGEPVSVTIGDLTTAQVSDYLPACTMTNYAYSQQIYMANEIGGAGKITAITYWLMNNSNYTRNYEIYMKEVSESAFASNDAWVLLSESDKVASYALANDTDEPVAKTITLNAPFEYSGNGNLMIAIRDITGQWSSGAKGLVNDVNGNKTLYSFRDSKAYDVADPAGTGLLYAKRNVVKIDMIAAPKPASGIVDNGDGTYIVDWGTEITIVATPAEDYHLVSWSNGAAVTEDNKQIVTVENELNISAFFKHDTYILTVEGAEVEIAKFADGTTDAVVLNPGTLVGVQPGDSVKLTTTATFSSANVADNLDITLHYAIEVIEDGIYDNEYALAITDSIYPIKGAIIEPMTPDKDATPEEQEAENEEGLEIYAYGYCHGSSYSIAYHLKSGKPDQYKIDFEDSRFTDVDWTDLSILGADGVIDVEIPVDLPTGDYSMTVTFRDSRFTFIESNPITVSFHVNLPETYVVALFDNVMAVVDTCECLTDIQWYWRANSTDPWTAIEGATGYYYKMEGGLSGEFFIKAKMNGIDTYTCPQEDLSLYGDTKQAKVSAYPNPVQNTTTVTIEGSNAWNHTIRIVNLMGNEMMAGSFEGNETTVDMSGYSIGNYMISVDGIVVKVIKQ